MIERIKQELAIRILPTAHKLRQKALYEKYLKDLQIIGNDCEVKNAIEIKRRKTLALGSNITLSGKGSIDAQGGVFIGSGSTIGLKVVIETENSNAEKRFDPVLINRGTIVGDNETIKPGSIVGVNDLTKGLLEFHGELVFIVGTGRSGTKSIAQLINNDPDSICYHDPFAQMNVWSCDKLYNRETSEAIVAKIEILYSLLDVKVDKLIGQSDQKFGALIAELSTVFPRAKFVWLIRDAVSFVNSAYPRGWFRNCEFGYEKNKMEFIPTDTRPFEAHAAHRVNGHKLGLFSEEDWKIMTAFERNCWYWSYWNEIIENQLEDVAPSRKFTIRLNELNARKTELCDFLAINIGQASAKKVNAAKYDTLKREDWSEEMEIIYDKHCKNTMKKWF